MPKEISEREGLADGSCKGLVERAGAAGVDGEAGVGIVGVGARVAALLHPAIDSPTGSNLSASSVDFLFMETPLIAGSRS